MTDATTCRDDAGRRADLLAFRSATTTERNGIDRVEIEPGDHALLHVFFVAPLPAGAYGLPSEPGRISVDGGERVRGIRAVSAAQKADGHLAVRVDRPGDHSTYRLTIDTAQLDPRLASVEFSFMAACPAEGDCAARPDCDPEPLDEPVLDYLAKDYAGFRRMLLDLLAQRAPWWTERNPADPGIAVLELLAHLGDELSYFQDAVAAEAYLDTARRRISVRRHARLVDYRVHEGHNAWTWLHVAVNAPVTLRRGTPVLTRVDVALRGDDAPPGPRIAAERLTPGALLDDPALRDVRVFETAHDVRLARVNNELQIHTWGDEDCCLDRDAAEAHLFALGSPSAPSGGLRRATAQRPALAAGDLLVLEEVRDPRTGTVTGADPRHRRVVRVVEVRNETDPLYRSRLVLDVDEPQAGWRLLRRGPGEAALPLQRVRWEHVAGETAPLCLSRSAPGSDPVRQVTVARGNIVGADHGLTVAEELGDAARVPAAGGERLRLAHGPLTHLTGAAEVAHDVDTGRPSADRRDLGGDPAAALPALTAYALTAGGDAEPWTPVPDLLDSDAFDRHVVAEVDGEGRATLRFGDGVFGRRAPEEAAWRVWYRIGNGATGRQPADAFAHLALPAGDDGAWLTAVTNPLPAGGGTDPETVAEVRRDAPQAFRARPLRAVVEADYATVARELPEVAGAVATFRWTGSWTTVFVGVDPRGDDGLVLRADGAVALAPALEHRVRDLLERRRLAGYDLEIRPPRYVSLEVDIDVCVARGHLRSDVAQAVREALGARALRGGLQGLFHPDGWAFGQPVHASRIVAAADGVPGVEAVLLRRLRRFGQPDRGEVRRGVLPVGPWEIARLRDDPSMPEHGVLRISTRGGRG